MSYYYLHRSARIEYAKKYAIDNRDLIQEKRQIYYACDCGRCVKNLDKTIHFKSITHQQYLQTGIKPISKRSIRKAEKEKKENELIRLIEQQKAELIEQLKIEPIFEPKPIKEPKQNKSKEIIPIKEKKPKKESIVCECGLEFMTTNRHMHMRGRTHVNYMNCKLNHIAFNDADKLIMRFD